MRTGWITVLVLGGLLAFQGGFTAGMLHLEQRDGFCVSCHLHQRKHRRMHRPPARVGELAAAHFAGGVGCAACHREPGPLGRVVTLYTLGVRDTVRFLSGDYREPERLAQPLDNALCIECHADAVARSGNVDTYHGNAAHNDRQDIRCTACHLHHEPGDPGYHYLQTAAFERGCASCHRGLFPDREPAQELPPATGERSRMRERLRDRGVRVR